MKLFGKNEPAATQSTASSSAPISSPNADPRADPRLIRVFDEFGRELFITKEQWRTSVLPGTLKSNWNSPDQLYGIIVGALKDGFFADIVDAAEHLYHVDPVPARGACMYGIALMKNNRLDEAESVLLSHVQKHGEEGYVLTNLPKVYSARNDSQKAEATLWHVLEVDPNQDNGFGWYAAIYRERSGEQAGLEALSRVVLFPVVGGHSCGWRVPRSMRTIWRKRSATIRRACRALEPKFPPIS